MDKMEHESGERLVVALPASCRNSLIGGSSSECQTLARDDVRPEVATSSGSHFFLLVCETKIVSMICLCIAISCQTTVLNDIRTFRIDASYTSVDFSSKFGTPGHTSSCGYVSIKMPKIVYRTSTLTERPKLGIHTS